MNCPVCHLGKTRVIDTRPGGTHSFKWVERRRACKRCPHRFNTLETVKGTPQQRKENPVVREHEEGTSGRDEAHSDTAFFGHRPK